MVCLCVEASGFGLDGCGLGLSLGLERRGLSLGLEASGLANIPVTRTA